MVGYYFRTLLTLILASKSHLSSRDACHTSTHFQLVAENSRADVPVTVSNFAQFLSVCAHLCLAHNICTSFNYNGVKFKCEILSYNHVDNEAKRLLPSLGWSFYQKATSKAHGNGVRCAEWQTFAVAQNGFECRCHDLENIALRKPTNQSSTCNNGASSRAVDGDTSNDYGWYPYDHSSCSHTCDGNLSWWMVEFHHTARVHSINITNRGDCCGDRLSNFNITIGDSKEEHGSANAMCVSNVGVATGHTKTFKCAPKLTGRYLYIKSNLYGAVALCEVKVFGELL